VAYAIPARDCSGYSSGGLGSPSAYRAWVDQLALGLGSARALVVVEPDALAQLTCLPEALRAERLEMLRYAVTRLSRESTRTYLDAGHSRWIPAAEMASRLRAAGVARARGFSLNVSNFHETPEQLTYGRAVAASVAKPFVVDTSRNGVGRGTEGWCNPPGRALGTPPTTTTGQAQVDAFLWVKTPGRSDGQCERDEPSAGTFWPDYAVGLAERALW
jgi:endoglucanase